VTGYGGVPHVWSVALLVHVGQLAAAPSEWKMSGMVVDGLLQGIIFGPYPIHIFRSS